MVVELSVKLKHECPFLEFSLNFGKKAVYHYCSLINDYLVIPEKLNEDVKERARVLFGRFGNLIIKEIGKNPVLTYISMDCPCNDLLGGTSLGPKMRELNVVPIYPTTYQNGFEYYRIYCKNQIIADHFIDKFNSLVELEILDLKEFGDDWIVTQTAVLNQLIESLTPTQIDILIQAFEAGYYNIPRSVKLHTIANINNKSRWAVEKNVRTAENKILNYIMPFIYLHKSDINIKPCLLEKLPFKVEI